MKQNQKNRYGRYNNFRGRPGTITRGTVMESSGPSGKLHGTALQLFEKYQSAAKDALLQNDYILSQSCMQYADHYARLQNQAIANEQMNRPQPDINNNNRKPADNNDTLPNFETSVQVQQEPVENTEEKIIDTPESAEDEKIRKMDLSVPVTVFQQKQKIEDKKRFHKPYKKPAAPKENTTEKTIEIV
ncbi:MAG: DUF4167 domain-containing protein [Lactobacillales bacterium]|jgi:hypothetical protein|nr:DUF4167 domain-containing protein [Lactobacillales bacterium]